MTLSPTTTPYIQTQRPKIFVILGLGFLFAFVSTGHAQLKGPLYKAGYALVVGNSNYQNWQKLPGVPNDVEEVSRVLSAKGFDVKTLLDVRARQLRTEIEGFLRDYGNDEDHAIVIYFAGHGYTDNAFINKTVPIRFGYFVGIDAPNPRKNINAKVSDFALSTYYFENIVKDYRARHILLVFDSCFSGALFEKSKEVELRAFCKGMASEPTREFITAGAEDQTVPDESVFRKLFVDGLAGNADLDNDNLITGSELGKYLKTNVSQLTKNRQTPQFSKIDKKGFETGEIIFLTGTPIQQGLFSRDCESPSPIDDAVDRALANQLENLHVKLAGAFDTGNKSILSIYLYDEFETSNCGTVLIAGKTQDYLKRLLPNKIKPISVAREDFRITRIDNSSAKLEVNETRILSSGKTEKRGITEMFKFARGTWLLSSYNACQLEK